ncbi:tyrosine-type recombinase/integrase [Candidatus Bathyarchaeota archaeon]|nr:tyrosine-type recombinase/integrase [Candidatus Bathyarchaeota archaeon]
MDNEMLKDWRKRSKRGYFISTPPEYELLLKDDSVKKWITNLKQKDGWRTTVPSFLRTLYKFTKYSGKSPKELIDIASITKKLDQREELTSASPAITELVQGFINKLLSSDKRERARHVRTCLTSFFKSNGVSLELETIPRVPKKEEFIPSKEQVYAMADYAGFLRNRAIILCMYQSGLGITALRNLKYGHVKKQLEKNRVPVRIRITSRINRKSSQVPFYAFFGAEACDSLRAYINERERKIQKMREKGANVRELTANSPLFASEGKNVPFGDKMAVSSIWRVVKDSAERAGLQKEKIQPNYLRKAFEAELSRSRIDEEAKKYLMGSPIQGIKYNVNKVEQKYLIRNFSRAELSKLTVVKEFVQSLGIKELEIKIQKGLEQNPQMTEMEAVRFIVRKEFASDSKKN